MEVDQLFNSMMGVASDAFGDGWESIKSYAPGEFKKLAVQMKDIVENVAIYDPQNPDQGGYPLESGKIILKMAINAMESVLVAVSSLTLIAVQNAINGILQVLKDSFSELKDLLL